LAAPAKGPLGINIDHHYMKAIKSIQLLLQIKLSLLPLNSYHTVIIAGYMMEGYFHTLALLEAYCLHTGASSSFTKDRNKAGPYHIRASTVGKGGCP